VVSLSCNVANDGQHKLQLTGSGIKAPAKGSA